MMRTNVFNYCSLLLMAIFTISVTSCEVEFRSFYDDGHMEEYNRRTDDLCSRTWVSLYRDADGNYCQQELDFYVDHTGVDYIRVKHPGGYTEYFEYEFRWSWDTSAQASVRMAYGPGDVSYLYNIYIGADANRMDGYLDGPDNYVEYWGKR